MTALAVRKCRVALREPPVGSGIIIANHLEPGERILRPHPRWRGRIAFRANARSQPDGQAHVFGPLVNHMAKQIEIRWTTGYTDVFPVEEFGELIKGVEHVQLIRGPQGSAVIGWTYRPWLRDLITRRSRTSTDAMESSLA